MVYIPKKFKIIKIKKFTPDVELFRVKSDMNPQPGQFFQVSVLGVGECPLASCSYNKEYIDILIRRAGNVTGVVFRLKEEGKFFIRGPYGKGYPLDKLKGKDLILVAGGTGIAPITSLIEYIEQNRKNFKNIYIYFGFKNEDCILLQDRINRWKKKFNLTICLDKKTKKSTCEQGFVHEVMDKHKPKLKMQIKNALAFLCGPEIMMKTVTEKLNSFGLENSKIYWSIERRMECGMGNCGRCLLQDVYVCKDGPVFRYDKIKTKLENEYSNEKTK